MYGAFQTLILALFAQTGLQAYIPAWPEVRPNAIIATPDWSDHRLYPSAARRKNQEGRVTAELLVDPTGTPQECRIAATSHFPELDAGTCKLMMKMRFDPAVDAQGKAVSSRFIRRFNWRLTEPVKFASSVLVVRVSLEGGRLQNCEVTEGAGPYLAYWSSHVCTFLSDSSYYYANRESGEAAVEFRLDAGDQANFLRKPWIKTDVSARERITFAVNEKGDASDCRPEEQYGFGRRGLNNLSPCGRLLSILWFEPAPRGAPQLAGTFETRVSY